jgi:sigma-B regulation protein RsbU (phosphoserine phosphatase)
MYQKRNDDPLINLLHADRLVIDALAESWLKDHTRAFGIWGNHLLLCWPESSWNELNIEEMVLTAPLKIGEQVIGRIGITGKHAEVAKARLYAEAGLISQMISMRIKFENAATELISQSQLKSEIDMAANIQLQLLPQKFPQIAHLDIFARSYPASQVGGDFYDFSSPQSHPFVFAVGDISGKGLPAALFMVMTRTMLHATAHTLSTTDASTIIAHVNEDLYNDFTEVGMFATVFVGTYDPDTQQLSYANAGHSPVVYCPADGPIVFLEADAPGVGVLPTSLCKNHTLPFHADDILIIGTDGLVECSNFEGEMFGYERMLFAVKSLSNLSSSQIGLELLEIVTQYAEGFSQLDDQTIVVLKGR